MVGKERKRKEGEDEKDLVACHLCPRKFSQEYSLRQHCIIVHASHYNCPHCNVAFAVEDVQGFKFHMFRHDLVGKYSFFYFNLDKELLGLRIGKISPFFLDFSSPLRCIPLWSPYG